MRERLQRQGIVFILFGILLALVGMAFELLGYSWAGGIGIILLFAALIMGVLGLMLSLSKDNGGEA